MTPRRAVFAGLLAALSILLTDRTVAQLRGHGGPVRALAVLADGRSAISGSFDQSAILWDIETGAARAVLRFHEGAVNAIAALPGGGFATAGEDGRIAVYAPDGGAPVGVLAAHRGPIVSLALSPDGAHLASASWDGIVRIFALVDGGEARVLEGHQGNVNAVAFLPDGRLVSAGYDATIRIWPEAAGAPILVTLPGPVNALAVSPRNEIAAAGADGAVRIFGPDGRALGVFELSRTPITALALSPDGARLAASTIGGEIALADLGQGKILRRIAGSGQPVWAVAFRSDGSELLSGGGDRLIRRWNPESGEPIGVAAAAEPTERRGESQPDRGAELFQACTACHSLSAGGENRAGPSLQRLDIVWSAATIVKLFEIGPSRYTPGTKMPEQVISDPGDREALVRFLERATKIR
jgi:cytochrome c